MTQTTFDTFRERPSKERAPAFAEVIVRGRENYPEETERLKAAAIRLLKRAGKIEVDRVEVVKRGKTVRTVTRYRGGFTGPEMVEEAGFREWDLPKWLPGVVCAWLSDAGVTQVGLGGLARENSSNGSRKGAKVNRWEWGPRGIAPVEEPQAPEVPTT